MELYIPFNSSNEVGPISAIHVLPYVVVGHVTYHLIRPISPYKTTSLNPFTDLCLAWCSAKYRQSISIHE